MWNIHTGTWRIRGASSGLENPQTDYLDQIVDRTPILVGDLILAEVLQGFRDDSDFEEALQPCTVLAFMLLKQLEEVFQNI